MDEQKKCPACGSRMPAEAGKCTVCGLEGLDLLFLNKEGYEKWEKEVLEPHKSAITLKVFAGAKHGLILTAWGDLYGIGNNQCRQLADTEQEKYDQPVLIARDVISAAADRFFSVYVTRDGVAHWQGEDAKYMPAFSDARAVYAESWYQRYWVVKNSGEVWCFGDNHDELLEERTKTVAHRFPEVSGVRHGFSAPITWQDNDSTSSTAAERFAASDEYRDLVQLHGRKNVELDENEVAPNKALKALYFTFQKGLEVYSPIIYVLNNWIYDPVLFRKEWREDLLHRIYCRPVLEEEFLRGNWEENPGIKEISVEEYPQLRMLEDGTVMLRSGKKLDWLQQPVLDLAEGSDMILMACANGDIAWADGAMFEEGAWAKMIRGEVNTCRLPEDA